MYCHCILAFNFCLRTKSPDFLLQIVSEFVTSTLRSILGSRTPWSHVPNKTSTFLAQLSLDLLPESDELAYTSVCLFNSKLVVHSYRRILVIDTSTNFDNWIVEKHVELDRTQEHVFVLQIQSSLVRRFESDSPGILTILDPHTLEPTGMYIHEASDPTETLNCAIFSTDSKLLMAVDQVDAGDYKSVLFLTSGFSLLRIYCFSISVLIHFSCFVPTSLALSFFRAWRREHASVILNKNHRTLQVHSPCNRILFVESLNGFP